ncbi:Xylanolytic transcriptional activator xlnR [Apiospora phragmitis]|uniref:Xylanolytic transcriptional activator xlnR n=1 Tax=Apiospora phragmitis TaxID=2905665 RepID=A0ABR1X670_9PEZI
MLSNPLQRFSPYHSLPANTLLSNAHVPTSHLHAAGLDAFGHGSQYSLQHLQQHVGMHAPHLARAPQPKHRQHPYGGPAPRATGAAGPIRRRISRACDQCNQLRTKCDGQHPCAHCIGRYLHQQQLQAATKFSPEFGLGCEYIRERKKRGKASRKDLAQQAAAQAAVASTQSRPQSPLSGDHDGSTAEQRHDNSASSKSEQQSTASENALNELNEDSTGRSQRTGSLDSLAEISSHQPHLTTHHATMDRDHLDSPTSLDLNGFGNVQNPYDRQGLGAHMMAGPSHTPYGASQTNLSDYPDIPYALQTQNPGNYATNASANFRMATSPLSAYPMAGETSPGWMSISSPPAQYQSHIPPPSYHQQLRYPVLNPLIPHLGSIIPVSLACDLIDLYFSSSSSAHAHPMSPYVLGFVFRKRSFLHPSKPRQCQPALLASILWVAAQTSDASFLTSVPSARGKICQKLLELTVSLLKPLIHAPSGEASPVSSPPIDGVALGGLGVAMPGSMSLENLSGESGAFGAAGSLDDVITYIHLATVVSASEYKGASLRWWNAAWSLARELKLGRELPLSASTGQTDEDGNGLNASEDGEDELGSNIASGAVTDEEREERRRIWWLTYIVDRHLALCYNRPLFLLDIECEGLMQPMDDTEWQNGNFRSNVTDPALPDDRVRGPHFECTGHSIFGYFLPLMTILGEIVDLHHARNHPRFGVGFRSAREWDDQAAEITRHLEMYERSLKQFEQQHFQSSADDKNEQSATLEMPSELDHLDTVSVRSIRTNSSRMTESDIQTRIVMSYGTHVMHVLHILLTGKWDPINLLDDNDLWISSQGFITATGHAVSAAEAISNILEFDPGLEFMPFFFGIYLLQGSFLLLLIADKLQLEASASVVRACETIIRAHEACMVTLSTEYQRNFSKVMRSALAQVRGRVPEDLHEQHQRRRELLALYRWTGDGTGLAL